MSDKILIAVAWPYANGPLHLGHLAGCYLPADIFARYHRMKGNQVLMVSGSDQHGTPVTITAEQQGLTPGEVANKYHLAFCRSWDQMGITFDLFTATSTSNHQAIVQNIFKTLQDKGYIYKDIMRLPYCPSDNRFLPDRYVEGTCPNCDNLRARGDQCDNCGKTLDPVDLKDPRCLICGTPPIMQDSEHFFLGLSAFQDRLLEWAKTQTHWRPNALNFTLRYLEGGLKDRAITRDITWGIPLPIEGYETKRIYVWFEAVIGYLSAAQEWAQQQGDSDSWSKFWKDPNTKSYYFIGKDNIPFHTIIWPAMITGYNEGKMPEDRLNLPYDVPANEFLSLEGKQFSTSRNWALWVHDYLERYEPDPLRYYLSINMPESGDSDFSWSEFVRRNNDELVATYGNLVNRVLTFTYKNFEGKIPHPGDIDSAGNELLRQGTMTLNSVAEHLNHCKFRIAITEAMSLAQAANRYLDQKAPWKSLNSDRIATATSLWVSISIINSLKIMLYPFIPFSSETLHKMLGFDGKIEDYGWHSVEKLEDLRPGQVLAKPNPLFTKFEDKIVMEETERLNMRTG